MRKTVAILLGLSLASAAYGGGDPSPPDTDLNLDTDFELSRRCEDGTIIWSVQECPILDRTDKPIETPPPKPHIGWDDPR